MNVGHTLAVGAFIIMALTVVFVKTGQGGGSGTDGGTQTSQLVNSLSGGVVNTIKALEGGG